MMATIVALIAFTAAPVGAAIIHVPSDYPTIQAGINAAADGDTVLVADGTYTGEDNKDVLINKAIPVMSENGPESCIIDVEGAHGSAARAFRVQGGAITIQGFTMKNGWTAYYGGAISVESGALIVTNCVFESCASPGWGAGAISTYQAHAFIEDSTFSNCWALEGGGAVLASDSTQVLNCSFENCSSVRSDGGAIIGCAQIYASSFTGCSAGKNGGAIGAGNTNISFCNFQNCGSTEDGGAIYSYNSSPGIHNCMFENCSAGWYGGAFSCRLGSPTISSCTFEENSAEYNGGAANAGMESEALFQNCTFTDNVSGQAGGALVVWDGSVAEFDNCLLVGNSSVESYGGAIFVYGSDCYVYNSTIADNSSALGGAGIMLYGADLTLNESVIWNGPTSVDFLSGGGISSVVTAYSCLPGGGTTYPGTGNIDEDPLFVDGPWGDYYLSQVAAGQTVDSPCVDAGEFLVGTFWGTTRSDGRADEGTRNIGFQYLALGDVTGDYKVTAGDALMAFRIALGYTPTIQQFWAADANVDGVVTAGDALQIYAWALGHEKATPALAKKFVAFLMKNLK